MIEDLAISIIAAEIGQVTDQRALAAALCRHAAKTYALLTSNHDAAEMTSNLTARFRALSAGRDVRRTLRRR